MRTDIATGITFALICGAATAAPTYSCFDPPDGDMTHPLGVSMEDVVESECCESLLDESDIEAGRTVVWDPINCNHGPGEDAISEAPLCRAHDTDGCRFCRDSCDDFEGLCVMCDEILLFDDTASPTPSPSSVIVDDAFTPAPIEASPTDAPFGIFPATPAPSAPAPTTPAPMTPAATGSPVAPTTDAPVTPATDAPVAAVTDAPVTPATDAPVAAATDAPVAAGTDAPVAAATDAPAATVIETLAPTVDPNLQADCLCVENLSETEADVLTRRGKTMTCDPSCSDGSDLVWGIINCNYFALGQNCRTCSESCMEEDAGWLDEDGFLCKPCSAMP